MPILTVQGVPRMNQGLLERLISSLQQAVALGLNDVDPEDVSVYLVPDMIAMRAGEEVIVFIDGLYRKPERTDSVLDGLRICIVEQLILFLCQHVPKCSRVEVMIRSMMEPNEVTSRNPQYFRYHPDDQ